MYTTHQLSVQVAAAIGVALFGLHADPVSAAEAAADRRQLLDTYCTTCHNENLKTAGMVLDSAVLDAAHVGSNADVWEKVLRKVKTGQMPPPGQRRPDAETVARFSDELATALDSAAVAAPAAPETFKNYRNPEVSGVRWVWCPPKTAIKL